MKGSKKKRGFLEKQTELPGGLSEVSIEDRRCPKCGRTNSLYVGAIVDYRYYDGKLVQKFPVPRVTDASATRCDCGWSGQWVATEKSLAEKNQ